MKEENHVILSVIAEEEFDKIILPFVIFSKLS